jgi:hypothetical protein
MTSHRTNHLENILALLQLIKVKDLIDQAADMKMKIKLKRSRLKPK